jgi:hypothetical protein
MRFMAVAPFVRAGRISWRYTVSVTDALLCPTKSLMCSSRRLCAWQALQDGRRDTFAALLANLPPGAFRSGVTLDFAVDTAWAVASPETHELFAVRRGRTYDQCEKWVAATLQATLAPSKAVRPPAGDTPE